MLHPLFLSPALSFLFLCANIAAMLKSKTFWVGVVVSIVLLGFLFYETDLTTIGIVLRNADYRYLIPALVLYFIGVGVRSVRWHYLLRSIKPIPSRRLFPVIIIGYMANDIFPLRIGELIRAFLVGERENISKASALVTIFLERVYDGLTMLLFIGVASFYLPLNDYFKTLLLFGTVLFSIVVIVLIGVASLRERADHVILRLMSYLPEKWGKHGARLIDSFLEGLSVLRNPFDAVAAFILTIIAWLFEAGMYFVLALGFGIVKPFAVFVLATAVANLVTIIPSTPGYIGVFDAPIKSILTLFGVEPNLAASYTLLLHAALVLPIVVLGLVFAWRAGLHLTQFTRRTDVSLESTSP